MKAKFYTVMVVPHQGGRLRSFALSGRFFVTLSALVALLAGAGSLAPRWYLDKLEQQERIDSLRRCNASLDRSLHEIDGQLARLRTQMAHYEQEARKLALVAGLDSVPGRLESTGGAQGTTGVISQAESVQEELDALALRNTRLGQSFQSLAAAYDKRERYLATIPTITPVSEGYFGSSFGWRRDPFTGRRVFHHGQDIVARAGTSVVAPASGRVVLAGRIGGLGLAVYLSHGGGIVSRFGHLSRIQVKKGQQVRRGDTIGSVGSTGRSLGSHLHYEIRVAGKPVDPRDFILENPQPPVG
ncbi:MAG: peptidoglycan DD-metalloendopeptidase family protein [Acidobacteriota bacterium]